MSVPKASEDLHAYNAWRRALTPLPVGTVIRFDEMYRGTIMRDDIKAGSHFKIESVRDPMMRRGQLYPADYVYEMRLVSPKGKPFKRVENWYVEGVAKGLAEGKLSLVE